LKKKKGKLNFKRFKKKKIRRKKPRLEKWKI